MGKETTISWTDSTWNPIRGCTRVSEGCRNCYAEMVARRFSGPGLAYEGLVRIDSEGEPHEWNGNIQFVERHLLDPFKWIDPRRIFVNSMSDLFHENVTDEMRDKIFAVMALCPQHTFQILTKRPENMFQYLVYAKRAGFRDRAIQDHVSELVSNMTDAQHARMVKYLPNGWGGLPLKHVHLGVSCENQKAADERVPVLLKTPAAIRFVSAEPLLDDISFKRIRIPEALFGWVDQDALTGDFYRYARLVGTGGPHLDWVIAGGESGNDFRPMNPEWAESLQEDCKAARVPFFMKQMSGRTPSIGASLIPAHLMTRQFPAEVTA